MKRVTNMPHPKSILKNKNKGHTKSKEKKFNPNEYLNSLIDQLHDPRFQTVRKRPPPSHKIQRNSALAYTTPITQRTITASKVRSKSSYSQYRKKSVPMREIVRVDIDNAITEEDNIIHFTEQTIQSILEPTLIQPKMLTMLSPVAAARRIQRAWRKYQTLKVVRKYYKNMHKFEQAQQFQSEEFGGKKTNKKMIFARTLKIKKEEESSPHNKTIRFHKGNIANLQNFSQEIGSSQTKEFYRQPQQNAFQEQKTVELINYGQWQSQNQEYTSKDLKLLIDLFHGKHEIASNEIDEHLNNICRLLPQSSNLNSYPTDQSQHEESAQFDQECLSEGVSPLVFNEMEKVIKEKCQLLKARVRLQYGQAQEQQIKIREGYIGEKMLKQLKKIEICKINYLKSMRLLRENMIKMQIQSSKVQKIGKEVGFKASNKIRKSYSADTLILKSIIEQVNLKNFNIDSALSIHRIRPQIYLQEASKNEESKEQQLPLLICPTSPPSGMNIGIPSNQNSKNSLNQYEPGDSQRMHDQIYNDSGISLRNSQNSQDIKQHISQFEQFEQEVRHSRSSSSINLSVNSQMSREQREDSRTLIVMKQCAQQMQQKIENSLISQIIQEIYLNSNMYRLIKPYIEKPFEFKPISDFDIISFLQVELPSFYPGSNEILLRFNQKINPNTKEILRLIRDFDYQIEEYELVLPQIVFKSYRKSVQDFYAIKIRAQSDSFPLNLSLIPNSLAPLAEQRWKERKQKRMKFLSFQRDLKIMYMKSIFNCYNELIIETKSFYTFMNGRSSIGPGQLTLALREYNLYSSQIECMSIMSQAKQKVSSIIHEKCMLPVFKNYKELDLFQKQMTKQICIQLSQNQFKWVNYMDEVLQIWQDISVWVCQELTNEVAQELAPMMQLM